MAIPQDQNCSPEGFGGKVRRSRPVKGFQRQKNDAMPMHVVIYT